MMGECMSHIRTVAGGRVLEQASNRAKTEGGVLGIHSPLSHFLKLTCDMELIKMRINITDMIRVIY